MTTDLSRQLLEEEEGRVDHAYPDSRGYLTIGVGCLIDPRKGGKLCDAAIDIQLDHDIATHAAIARAIPGFDGLNSIQQAAIISMCFQLGSLDAFPNMRAALARGDAVAAAKEGRDSEWWRSETKLRAEREMRMLETGIWVPRLTKV